MRYPDLAEVPRALGLDLLGLDQMHLRQQLPATRVLEMLQSNRIDRHSHLRQVSDNPVCAGVDGLGDDKSAMALVELSPGSSDPYFSR